MSVLKYYDPITQTYKPLSMLIGGSTSDGTGSDKHYETSFTSVAEVTVQHGLGKQPAVTVMDSANDEVEGQVEHVDNNTVIVRFSAPFSGRVICN